MKFVAQTDVGKHRDRNEDAFDYDAEAGFFVVADGMGGLDAGDIASRATVAIFQQGLSQPDSITSCNKAGRLALLQNLAVEANDKVHTYANLYDFQTQMGTTLIAGFISGSHLLYVHVGDSRIYLIRQDKIRQLTRDHSLVQEMVDMGKISLDEARTHIQRNIINQAIGLEPVIDVDCGECQLEPGDILLACTDGLHDMITSDLEIADLIQTAETLDASASNLVQKALENGGMDNVTVVLVAIE